MTQRTYRLVIAGDLNKKAVRALKGMALSHDGYAPVLVGTVSDQAQFYELMRQVFELGLTIRSAKPIGDA